MDTPRKRFSFTEAFSIPLLCLGIGTIACCALLPMVDSNRKLAWEREKLKQDLAQLTEQIRVNDDFLKRVTVDPELSERLAQRQMRMIREGTAVLKLKEEPKLQTSPFQMVNVPQPVELAAYRTIPGTLGRVTTDRHMQLMLIGGALLVIAVALVSGKSDEVATVESESTESTGR